MKLSDYLAIVPKTLEERRVEMSAHYRKEKLREYKRKYREKTKGKSK
jgi:hypothetical protein